MLASARLYNQASNTMHRIATRRCISTAPRRSPCSSRPQPARTINGAAKWLATIRLSASVATTTMLVAALRPPRNASSASPSCRCASGSASTYRSDGTPAGPSTASPSRASGRIGGGDQQQIQRKQPARRAHVIDIAALDHAGMKLVRHREHGQRAEQDQRRKAAGIGGRRNLRRQARRVRGHQQQHAKRQHRHQLEQRLERHRQHQSRGCAQQSMRAACRTASRTTPSAAPRTAHCPAMPARRASARDAAPP